ncbi:hypothetical protein AB0N92_11710 [Streptomyces sp. NPDC093248]
MPSWRNTGCPTVNVQANQTVLPRPGWRHAARLVEHTAGEDE